MSRQILIGPAEEKIKEFLSQSDPIEAIRSIQQDYGLDLDGIDASYPLLDLCGYSRLEIHLAVLEQLNKAVIDKINSPSFQLEDFYDIFERTFPYINIPQMQPIPMALLNKFERHIEDDILDKLKSDIAVFENCPLNIKKRIWKKDEAFFQQQMLSMLNDYHHDEGLQSLAMNLKPDSYQEVIEERRSHPIMLRVMEIIGGDPTLYVMFMEMIRLVFEATPYPSLCSLRVDILMNFHDQDVSEIYELDECHRLIWSLDTCVRNQNMDVAIISKIKECFDDVKNGTRLYGDFAMVLMDPLISNFLSSCIVRWLRNSVDEDAPENLEELINYNSKLLNLAQHAPTAVANNTKIAKLDKDLKGRFWNSLCQVIVSENSNPNTVLEPTVIRTIQELLGRNEVARKVFVQYLLDRVFENDVATLHRCLPLILSTMPSLEDTQDGLNILHIYTYKAFLRTLINTLVKKHLLDCVSDRRWRQSVMESFLLKTVEWDVSVHEQMVWLLAEFFYDAKYFMALATEHVAFIEEWANICALHGKRNEKSNKNLHNAYSMLLYRSSQILEGRLQIRPQAAIDFCRSIENE
ncbi:cofactor of BRCA1-domain-containing protein [Absidia repens]|uniref:Cofactor of BRCA1-domain-containing protein n=1 Tax=Absidia repens TaxID=90262 RepID=A0A1X2J0D5_9FUNG|nr:cofactor of BRCA1-domain-containing protein [Absidia repens]